MKLLHAITGLNVGGAETMLAKLMESGPDDAEVLSMLTPGALAPRIAACGVPVHTLGMRIGLPSPWALLRLLRIARKVRPDVIQGWMHHGNLAASLAAWSLPGRPPVVWNIRHSLVDLAHEKPMTRAVLRVSGRLSRTPAAIIYNARVSAEQYETTLGFPGESRVIIPNGFDCATFAPRPDARATLERLFGIAPGATVVGMVARLHPMKNQAGLAEAVRRARAAGHDLHLLMVGHGLEAPPPALAEALRALPADRVTLSGVRHDVADWMPGLDIAALPSAWGEGFPNFIGEAMACGVPCIATDVGDSGWVMGPHGLLVPPLDAAALAEALGRLASLGPDGRKQLGAQARARVVDLFSLAEVARQYDSLYERVLSERRGQGASSRMAEGRAGAA